jgi:asparagine synthase (glutamine-hydrolysing)
MPDETLPLAGPALRDSGVWHDARHRVEWVERGLFEPAGPESSLAAVARMETRGFLACQLLRDIDAVSMAHGLEVRMPFVDHELQAAVWPALGAHPSLLKRKRLLREALTQPLPEPVMTASKSGSTLPFNEWMRGRLRDDTRHGLRALALRGWITMAAAQEVWASFEQGQTHWSRAWGLSMLGRFLESAR